MKLTQNVEGPRLPKLKEDVPAIARVEKLDHPNRITITSPTLAPNKIASSKRGAAGGSYPVSLLLYILLLVAGDDADDDDSDHGNRWKQSVNERQDRTHGGQLKFTLQKCSTHSICNIPRRTTERWPLPHPHGHCPAVAELLSNKCNRYEFVVGCKYGRHHPLTSSPSLPPII